jgi:Rad3-related DNA helicase
LRQQDVQGDDADERDRLLGDLSEWLDNAEARDAASLVEPRALVTACADAGRVVSRLWAAGRDRPPYLRGVALISATLGAGDGDDFTDLLRRIGVFSASVANYDARASRSISMSDFGAMRFVLADRRVPPPFVDADDVAEEDAAHGRRLSPDWLAYVVAGVRSARARGGRVLVLCASFDDAGALGAMLPEALQHVRGTKLADWVGRFLTSPDAVLITPAAWAGLDLPRSIAHVVIPRIPFAPVDEAVDVAYRRVAAARGLDPATMKAALMLRNRADAARRLRQGMGRGIRVRDDSVTVWILDPRFPLPSALLRQGLRQRITQGAAARHAHLLQAVPARFRVGASAPLNRAEILPVAADGEGKTK